MKKHEEMIYQIIFDVLKQTKTAVKEITATPGGQTNDSYFVKVNQETYVVRLPGKGTAELLSRDAEKANLEYATALGINPKLIYYDATTGVKISQFIEGAKTLTTQMLLNESRMDQVVTIFRTLHQAKQPMGNCFDLFQMMKDYEQLVAQVNEAALAKIEPLREMVWELVKEYESFLVIPAPCHIDACNENLLEDKFGKIYLIDWEYSGMFDPLFDLATLILAFELEESEEIILLSKYFGRIPTTEELQRIHFLKIFLDYNWALWYFYKETKGETFDNEGIKRVIRALENIYSYKGINQGHLVG